MVDQPGGVGRRQVDDGGQQHRLGLHAAFEHLRAQGFVGEALVGGMLVDQHEAAVGGDRDDVGVEYLGDRGAKRGNGLRRAPGGWRADGGGRASGASENPAGRGMA